MYHTESDSSREGQDDSFSTIQANNDAKNNRLKEVNKDLLKENQQLRQQFEEALELANQTQPLHQKNQELAQENQNLKAERDDLYHRLEISVAKIKERDNRLEEERKNRNIQQDTNIIAMNKEIEKIKKSSKEQLDQLVDELSKAQQKIKESQVQQQMLHGRIDRLLQNGERYFTTKFNSVDDFIDFLDKPSQNLTTPDGTIVPQNALVAPSDRSLEKRIHKLKQKLHQAVEAKQTAESDLDRLAKELHQCKLDNKTAISNIEVRLHEAEEAKGNLENKLHQEASKYENQINQLRIELQNAKSKVSETPFASRAASQPEQIVLRDIDEKPAPIEKKQSRNDVNAQIFQQRVDSLSEELKKAQAKADEATEKARNFENKYQQASILNEKQKTDIRALTTTSEEQAKEIESLRKSLHAKAPPMQIKDIKEPKPAPNVVKYQRQIEDYKNQILNLNNQIGKLKTQIEKLELEVQDGKQQAIDIQEALKKSQDDFADYRAKAEAKKPLTADDIVPPSAFHCPELEPQLAASIAKIAHNSSLQPASKIQSCFKSIQTYYGSQLQSVEGLLKQSIDENKFISTSLNKFIVELSIAINDQPQTIDDFFKNGGDNLIQKVVNLRTSFDDLKHREEELQGIITRLAEAFGTDVNDPIAQINSMKNKFSLQREIIAKKTKKLHEKRRECQAIATAAKENDTRLQQQIDELNCDVNNNKTKIDQLQKSNTTLTRENQRLQSELDTAVSQLSESEAMLKDKTEDLIKKLNVENAEKVKQLTQKYNELVAKYQSINSEYGLTQDEIARLSNLVSAQKRSIDVKDSEYRTLMQQMVDKEQSAELRLQTEKTHITETYESAIEQLKNQCEAHRSDVERMAKVVAEHEQKVNSCKMESYQAKKEMRRMEMELSQNNEKIERERKLLETSFAAKRIAIESDFTMKLNNERAKFEAEKRRICGYGAEAFKAFFNPNVEIDEKSYRGVIEQAKEELTRLAYSDAAVRRLVGARDNQTTDDAVAQLLLQKA
ncbi:hypothetical protein M9Y10_038589 [Tritrichomonas musculus]|uniref:Viral A-type inclusion protein n=1 Tax=Tritrichomonas musculus TaxID=1915356 RepID=A0ABR2KC12_9EUKA